MSRKNIVWIGIVIMTLTVAVLPFKNDSIKQTVVELCLPEGVELQITSEDEMLKIEEPASFLTKKDGFLELVNANLEKKGYTVQMLVSIYSIHDIRVKILLENKSATDFVHREINSIFYESVKDSHLDSKSFTLDISDDAVPDRHKR